KLPAARLDELVAYVHGLHAPAVETPAPGDAAAGEQFFFAEGHCGGCHTVRGVGGWIGPDLSDLGARLSLMEIETALQDPGRRITARSPATATVRSIKSMRQTSRRSARGGPLPSATRASLK